MSVPPMRPPPARPPLIRVDRRTTLGWLAGALAGTLPGHAPAAAKTPAAGRFIPTPGGYGTDPDLNAPTIPWPRTLGPARLRLVADLADIILPADETGPAPSALGIQDFVDEWVSAPYPAQRADRRVILAGLADIARQARQGHPDGWPALSDPARLALLDTRAQDAHPHHAFFLRVRFLVVGAYFTSDVGARALGYTGNVALDSYPPPSGTALAAIDRACRRLGI